MTDRRPAAARPDDRRGAMGIAEPRVDSEIEALGDQVLAGDRRALARAITLIESRRADHQYQAEALLAKALPATGRALRVGITGAPGVGKSTMVEVLGLRLVAEGRRVAVLPVDPSSARSGGSILGDKTRMEELGRAEAAFIRPSPTGGTLGGVARRTHEAMLLCEAAGFDPVIIETVGVGQSETAVAAMTDIFLLLLAPGGGDDLQGLKRGIVELADLILINKTDGALAAVARALAADYSAALTILTPRRAGWRPEVLLCSALEGCGIAEAWEAVGRCAAELRSSGELTRQRREQSRAWLWREVQDHLADTLRGDPELNRCLDALETEVAESRLMPSTAARRLLETYFGRKHGA